MPTSNLPSATNLIVKMTPRNASKKIAVFAADTFVNLALWLLAYACASIAAGYTLLCFGVAIDVVQSGGQQLTFGSVVFGGLFWAYAIGIVALAPAILGNGIWEIFGFRTSVTFLTGLGAAVGSSLSLMMALGDFGQMEFGDYFLILGFGTAGAIGGFVLGRLRTGLLASKQMVSPTPLNL